MEKKDSDTPGEKKRIEGTHTEREEETECDKKDGGGGDRGKWQKTLPKKDIKEEISKSCKINMVYLAKP